MAAAKKPELTLEQQRANRDNDKAAKGVDNKDHLTNKLTCPKCGELYDLEDYRPRQLSCDHTCTYSIETYKQYIVEHIGACCVYFLSVCSVCVDAMVSEGIKREAAEREHLENTFGDQYDLARKSLSTPYLAQVSLCF